MVGILVLAVLGAGVAAAVVRSGSPTRALSVGAAGTESPSTTSPSTISQAATRPPVPSQTPTTKPSTAASALPLDKSRLEALLVRQSDLPPGWAPQPSTTDSSAAANSAALAKCTGTRDVFANTLQDADSSFTVDAAGAEIDSSGSFFKTQEDVASDVAVLANPKTPACVSELFKAQLTKSLAPTHVTVARVDLAITPGSGGGRRNVVATSRGIVTLTSATGAARLYIDSVYITGRQTEVSVDFMSANAPLDPALRSRLANAVADRVASL
jgi:hypothetical protein